ncbi:MAG: hypothetical protein AABW50_02065 [Nanoarchaeota archaeon]
MLTKEMNKVEIENYLKGKGDFVQIDHLTRFLTNKALPTDKRRFVYEKLAEIYEKRRMFAEAAKTYNAIAIASVTFSDKTKNHIKEADMHIKSGSFEYVDAAMKKAMTEVGTAERNKIYSSIKEFYKKQAEVYIKDNRRNQAMKIYEKLMQMSISDMERTEIKGKLLNLYESLGRIKEYFALKGGNEKIG